MARSTRPRRARPVRRRRGADAPTASSIRALEKAVAALESLDARFALIGGQAVAARTAPRFTEDVDFAVATAGDDEAQRLVFALQQRGWIVRASLEQTETGRLATVRLSPPAEREDVLVDLLFAACGVEQEAVGAAESLALGYSKPLPVASVGHLMAMKALSESEERLQDRIDLQNLTAVARPGDLETARRAVELIRERGYARGKRLAAILGRYTKGRG
ncbi:MAG: nucleotidyl transferase AbiEii/AbiGii toxin family protein [Myxococcales bacterium]|nr:nucleotidyl transferase AbiEii/AbiGii toxin family protein [Myxococcales bacterium]